MKCRGDITPVIGILNHVETPDAEHLVCLWGNPRDPRGEYISAAAGPMRLTGPQLLLKFTEIEKFGVVAELTPTGDLLVRVAREGTATYPDGRPRWWQGRDAQILTLRLATAPTVIRALKATAAKWRPGGAA